MRRLTWVRTRLIDEKADWSKRLLCRRWLYDTMFRNGGERDRTRMLRRLFDVLSLQYHPTTLDAYRSAFPLPMPWHILWRVRSAGLVTLLSFPICWTDLVAGRS
jgi:hypothetical protein